MCFRKPGGSIAFTSTDISLHPDLQFCISQEAVMYITVNQYNEWKNVRYESGSVCTSRDGCLAALARLLRIRVCARANGNTWTRGIDRVLRLFQHFVRYYPINICANQKVSQRTTGARHVPVRMLWKADSTFEASNAEVSMNESPFSAASTSSAWRWERVRMAWTYSRMPLPHLSGPPVDVSNHFCSPPT